MRSDGYTVFYGVNEEKFAFTCICRKSCSETNANTLTENICEALGDLKVILKENEAEVKNKMSLH